MGLVSFSYCEFISSAVLSFSREFVVSQVDFLKKEKNLKRKVWS